MKNNYIPLRERRDVGEMTSVYFAFFKQNFKPFFNIFISYNGLFILGFLIVSYLLVTGFVGAYGAPSGFGVENDPSNFMLLIGVGAVGFIVLFLLTAILNYSLAAVYMVQYVENRGEPVEKRKVWETVKQNFGKIALFIILMMVCYLIIMIVGIILAFIPIVGTFAYYLLVLAYTSWMGLSFMAMIHDKREVTDAFAEGFKLLKTYFWKCVLSNLVIGMLLGLLMLVVLMVPGILIAIYAFHSLETGVELETSAVANIVWTLGLSVVLVLYTINQAMAQFINGIVFYSVREEAYNEATRERIDNIGTGE